MILNEYMRVVVRLKDDSSEALAFSINRKWESDVTKGLKLKLIQLDALDLFEHIKIVRIEVPNGER
jgi:hypothetical protein